MFTTYARLFQHAEFYRTNVTTLNVPEMDLRYKRMYWLKGRNSSLSLHNKLLLYKQILKPIWTYSIQLWGCTKQ